MFLNIDPFHVIVKYANMISFYLNSILLLFIILFIQF